MQMAVPDLRTLWRTTAFRLTAAVAALFALAAIVAIGVIYWQVNAFATREVALKVNRSAQVLAAEIRNGASSRLSRRLAQTAQGDPGFLYVLEPPESGQQRAGNLAGWPNDVGADGRMSVFRSLRVSGDERLAIGFGQRLRDGSRLLIAQDASVLGQLAQSVAWWFAIGIGGMAVAGVAAGLLVSRMVLGRIGEITATSRRIMSGRLSERIALAGSDDELDDLAGNLNRMLSRIEELMAGFQEVSDNIAHDLKTPLNRLRNRAEEALNSTGGERESLERILVEADDLIRTFNALLQVARLEAGATDPEREPIDLVRFVGDVVEFYAPVAEDEGASITFEGQGEVMVSANRQLIAQALTNLIENALKYGIPEVAQPNGQDRSATIAITVAARGREAVLSVRDSGPGIPEADRELALKRFGRLDGSRSKPGTGLGLSLVRAVARLHDGQLVLGDGHPGLTVTISLPLMPAGSRSIGSHAVVSDRANGQLAEVRRTINESG